MLDQSFRYNPQTYGPTEREKLLQAISAVGMTSKLGDSVFTGGITEEERLKAEEELARAKALAGEQGIKSSSSRYTNYRSTPETVGPMVDAAGNIVTADTGSAIDMGEAMSPRREAFDGDYSQKLPLIGMINFETGTDLKPEDYSLGQLQDILARATNTSIADIQTATGFKPNELPGPMSDVKENMSLEQLNEFAQSLPTVPSATLLEGLSEEDKIKAIEEGFNQTVQGAVFRNLQQENKGLNEEDMQAKADKMNALLNTNFDDLNDSQRIMLGRSLLSNDIIDTSAMSDEEIGRLHMGGLESFVGQTLGAVDWLNRVAPGMASIASNKIIDFWKSNGLLGKVGIPNPVVFAYNAIKDAWTNNTDPSQDDPQVTAFFQGTPAETVKDLNAIGTSGVNDTAEGALNIQPSSTAPELQQPKAPSLFQAFTEGKDINAAVDAQTDLSDYEKQALKTAALGTRAGLDNLDRWTNSVMRGVFDIFFEMPSAEELTQRFQETEGREGVDIGGVTQQRLQQEAADINALPAVEGGAMLTEELIKSPLLIGGGSATALAGKKAAELGLRGAARIAPGVISTTGFGARAVTEATLPAVGAGIGYYNNGWQGAAVGAGVPLALRTGVVSKVAKKLGAPKAEEFIEKFNITGKARNRIIDTLNKSPQAGTYIAGKLAKMADKVGDAKLAGYWGEVASQGVGSATLMGVMDGLAVGDVGAGFQSAMQNGALGTGAALLLSARVPASRFTVKNLTGAQRAAVRSMPDRRVMGAYKGIYGDNIDIVPAKNATTAQRQAYEYAAGDRALPSDQVRPADMPQQIAPNAWLIPDPAGNNKAKLFVAPDNAGSYANSLHDSAPSVLLNKATDPAAKAQLYAAVYRNTPMEQLNKIAADNNIQNWRSNPAGMERVLGIAARSEFRKMGSDILRPSAKGDNSTTAAIRSFINGKGSDIQVPVQRDYTVAADPQTGKYRLQLEDRPSAGKRQAAEQPNVLPRGEEPIATPPQPAQQAQVTQATEVTEQATPAIAEAARPAAAVKAAERIQARKKPQDMGKTEKAKELRKIGLTPKFQKQLTPEQQNRAINMGPNFRGLSPGVIVQMVKRKVKE